MKSDNQESTFSPPTPFSSEFVDYLASLEGRPDELYMDMTLDTTKEPPLSDKDYWEWREMADRASGYSCSPPSQLLSHEEEDERDIALFFPHTPSVAATCASSSDVPLAGLRALPLSSTDHSQLLKKQPAHTVLPKSTNNAAAVDINAAHQLVEIHNPYAPQDRQGKADEHGETAKID